MPIHCTSTSAVSNVPTIDPTVDSAYRPPAVRPAPSMRGIAMRITYGGVTPSSTAGARNSSTYPTPLPTRSAHAGASTPSVTCGSTCAATSGTSAVSAAAPSRVRESVGPSTCRSASRPPSR